MNNKFRLKLFFEIGCTLLAIIVAVHVLVFIFTFIAQVVCGGKGYLLHMI